jgi:hypothetical protein
MRSDRFERPGDRGVWREITGIDPALQVGE